MHGPPRLNPRCRSGSSTRCRSGSTMRLAVVFATVWLGWLPVNLASAQTRRNAVPQPGWRVQFEHLGNVYVGEIVRYQNGRWPTLRFWDGDEIRERTVPTSRVRAVLGPNPATVFRRWRAADGDASIVATLDRANDTHVRLKKRDGSTSTLKIEQLSANDQTHVNNVRPLLWPDGRLPGQPESTPGPGPSVATSDRRDRGGEPIANRDQIVAAELEPRLAATPMISTSITENLPTGLAPDPLPPNSLDLANVGYQIAGDQRGEPHIALDATGQYVMMDVGGKTKIAPRDRPDATHRVHFGKLDEPAMQGDVEVDPYLTGVGVSPGGQWLYFRGRPSGGRHVAYYRLPRPVDGGVGDNDDPEYWMPCSRHIRDERFLSDDRLVCSESGGPIQVWNVADRSPTFRIDAEPPLAISGGGRYLAARATDADAVVLVDLEQRRCVARIAHPEAAGIVFHPDGDRVVVVSPGGGEVVGLADRSLDRSFALPLLSNRTTRLRLACVGDRYLAHPGEGLIDTQTARVIWKTESAGIGFYNVNDLLIGEMQSDRSLTTFKPLSLDVDRLASLDGGPDPDAIRVPVGAVASIDVSELPFQSDIARADLQKRLSQRGYRVHPGEAIAPNATLKIRVTGEVGRPQTIRLKDFFEIEQSQTATYTTRKVTVEMRLGNRVISRRTQTYDLPAGRGPLRLRAGETAQQAVSRMTTPNLGSVGLLLPIPRAGGLYDPRGSSIIGTGPLTTLAARAGTNYFRSFSAADNPARRAQMDSQRDQAMRDRERFFREQRERRERIEAARSSARSGGGNSPPPGFVIGQFMRRHGGPAATIRIVIGDPKTYSPDAIHDQLVKALGDRPSVTAPPTAAGFAMVALKYDGPLSDVKETLGEANIKKVDEAQRLIFLRE